MDPDFERALKTYIYQLFPSGKLRAAALYALFPGGKRLRPKLVYLFGKVLGVPKKKLTILACALEMIHNYTLIHDDLPAMDDDDWRRGKPTLHKKFDEATAILVGDALLTQAFELLASLKSPRLSQFVASCVGAKGVIQGQMLDLGTNANFLRIYRLKTSKLFEAAIVGPSYLSKTSLQTKKKLSNFASLFGLCFQIADDIEDAQETHRKKTPTLAKLLGVKKTQFLLCEKLIALLKSLDRLPFSSLSQTAIKNFVRAIPGFNEDQTEVG